MAHPPDPRRWVILGAVCVALAIIVVDNTILNVALPSIEEDLGAGPAVVQAIVNSYVVVFAGLLVVSGLVADRYGRRLAVMTGLGILAAASLGAALAPDAIWLIAARALMGIGAALVMPGTLAVLVRAFAPDERVKAFAAWSAVGSAAMAVGPVLGGILVERWGWPGIFVINALLAALALILIGRWVPESREPQQRTMDVPAAVALTLAMATFVAAVICVPDYGLLSPLVLGSLAAAAVSAAVFWTRQRRTETPMIEMSLYRNRRFAGASAAVAVLAIGTGSVLFVLTQHLQHVMNYGPLQTGWAVVPLAVGVVGASAFGTRLPARIGYRRSIITGFTVTAAGFAVLATLTPNSPYVLVMAGLFIAGAGSGLASPSVHTTVLGAVPTDRAGMGAALNDTHQQLGVALGIALIGSVLAAGYRLSAPPELSTHARSSLGRTTSELAGGQPELLDSAQLAFTQAQSVAMLGCTAFAVAGALIARCLPPSLGR